MKTRADLHWARKLWHFFGVVTVMVIYHNLSRDRALQIGSLLTLTFVSLDILRLRMPGLNRVLMLGFAPVMRAHEQNQLAGTSYLLVGVMLIIYVFPKEIVDLSLLFLAVGDPLASYVGLKWGRDKLIGRKSLQGTMAAFFACTLISGVYYYLHDLMVERIFIVSIFSGLIAALTELIPIFRLDDNFTFPVASACLLWMVFNLFGGII